MRAGRKKTTDSTETIKSQKREFTRDKIGLSQDADDVHRNQGKA